MAIYRAGLFLSFMFLIACGSNSSSGSADAFQAACESTSNMGTDLCHCIANNAKSDLSPNGLALLTAGLNQDEAATMSLRKEMSADELVAAGMYMVSAPQKCAQAMQ